MSEIRLPKVSLDLPDEDVKSINDLERYNDDTNESIVNLEQRLFGMIVGGIKSVISADSENPVFDAQIAFNEFLEDYKNELFKSHLANIWIDEYRYGDGEIKTYFDEVEKETKRQIEIQRLKDKQFQKLNLNKWNFNSYNVYDYLERHQELLEKYLAQENGMTSEDIDYVYKLYKEESDKLFREITGNIKEKELPKA